MKLEKLLTFRNILILGALVSIGVTLSEVLRDKQANFYIFQLATQDFWNSTMPYGENWMRHGFDYFLYTPVFNVLFAPFAYLPWHTGEFIWNLFNYSMLTLSIYSFPNISTRNKARTLLYLIPIIATSQLSFQYNIAVAYLFIFAFSLLERGKAHWAILLIMLSATTKLYGIVELSILLFYPRFWRNMLLALIFGVGFIALPLIKLNITELGQYYTAWGTAIGSHETDRTFQTFYDLNIFTWGAARQTMMTIIQIGTFAAVAALVFFRRERWANFNFRVGILAALMGWCILFGTSSEGHTYVIALAGYLLWYWSMPTRGAVVQTLYWATLVVIVLVPLDVICPMKVALYIANTLDLNKWIFLITWCTMLWHTLGSCTTKNQITQTK